LTSCKSCVKVLHCLADAAQSAGHTIANAAHQPAGHTVHQCCPAWWPHCSPSRAEQRHPLWATGCQPLARLLFTYGQLHVNTSRMTRIRCCLLQALEQQHRHCSPLAILNAAGQLINMVWHPAANNRWTAACLRPTAGHRLSLVSATGRCWPISVTVYRH
jgi:hypothetical protein